MPSVARVFVLLVVLVSGAFGQTAPSSDASTVAPDDIFSLSEEDFQLWISGRQPKAWGSADGSGSNSLDTASTMATSTTTPRSTLPSVFRTTSTTESPPSAITAPSTTPNPLDFFTTRPSEVPSDGKSWFEDDASDSTVRPDVLGDQFKPAGEDFAQWLERQMNKVQEVTFTPQTSTLTGDPFPGLVTRLTTTRNRIPAPTTFAPFAADSDSDAAVTLPPPTATAPFPPPAAPSATFDVHQPAGGQPVDLQKWLRDQLQLSQSLTDRLLAQWSPSGSFVRADGHSYQPTAVSYQTSALIHGLQGVSHSGQVRNDPNSPAPLPFPGSSHTTDSYLSHQKPPGHPAQPPAPAVPIAIRHGQPAAFYPAGSFYYSHPSVPHYGPFVGGYRAPVVIRYH